MQAGPKTIVITGGNSGIGFETARTLAARGWRVIVTGRDEAKLGAAVAQLGDAASYRLGDFASLASVRELAGKLQSETRIDVLLNNAGIALSNKRTTADGNDMMVQVNHLAPFLLTNLLLDKLKAEAPARIVCVASRLHRVAMTHGFDDFQLERHYSTREAYARTKLYNVMFARELARRLAGTGVTANALHPGGIRTRIGRDGDITGVRGALWALALRFTMKPVEAGAKVPAHLATAPALEGVTGEYVSTDLAPAPINPLAADDAACRRLWEMSARLVAAA